MDNTSRLPGPLAAAFARAKKAVQEFDVQFVLSNRPDRLTFSKSEVDAFQAIHPTPWLRWGQAFYYFFKLDRCTQDKAFCEALYQASDAEAKEMVRERTDKNQ